MADPVNRVDDKLPESDSVAEFSTERNSIGSRFAHFLHDNPALRTFDCAIGRDDDFQRLDWREVLFRIHAQLDTAAGSHCRNCGLRTIAGHPDRGH